MDFHRRLSCSLSVILLTCALATAAVAAGDHLARVELSDDVTEVLGIGSDGEVAFTYAIDAWRAWADEHLAAALGGPVTIGDVELDVSTYHAFGFADLAPDGEQVLVVATTYAMLTTASVFTLLDLASGELAVVAEPAYGDVESLVWNPDGRYVAYTLGSARAFGDGLHVDDLIDGQRLLELDAHAALATEAGASLGAVVDGFGWFPGFREPTWEEGGELRFLSHDPAAGFEEGAVRWRFDLASGALWVDVPDGR